MLGGELAMVLYLLVVGVKTKAVSAGPDTLTQSSAALA
jgi:hypothetical protein